MTDMAYPAKTPPSKTKHTLRPNFHQKIGLSGGSSGSIGFSAKVSNDVMDHSRPLLAFRRADSERRAIGTAVISFERERRVGMAEILVRRGVRRGGIFGWAITSQVVRRDSRPL